MNLPRIHAQVEAEKNEARARRAAIAAQRHDEVQSRLAALKGPSAGGHATTASHGRSSGHYQQQQHGRGDEVLAASPGGSLPNRIRSRGGTLYEVRPIVSESGESRGASRGTAEDTGYDGGSGSRVDEDDGIVMHGRVGQQAGAGAGKRTGHAASGYDSAGPAMRSSKRGKQQEVSSPARSEGHAPVSQRRQAFAAPDSDVDDHDGDQAADDDADADGGGSRWASSNTQRAAAARGIVDAAIAGNRKTGHASSTGNVGATSSGYGGRKPAAGGAIAAARNRQQPNPKSLGRNDSAGSGRYPHDNEADSGLQLAGAAPDFIDRTTVIPRPLQLHPWQQPQAMKVVRDRQRQVTEAERRLKEIQEQTRALLEQESQLKAAMEARDAAKRKQERALNRRPPLPASSSTGSPSQAGFSPSGGYGGSQHFASSSSMAKPRSQHDVASVLAAQANEKARIAALAERGMATRVPESRQSSGSSAAHDGGSAYQHYPQKQHKSGTSQKQQQHGAYQRRGYDDEDAENDGGYDDRPGDDDADGGAGGFDMGADEDERLRAYDDDRSRRHDGGGGGAAQQHRRLDKSPSKQHATALRQQQQRRQYEQGEGINRQQLEDDEHDGFFVPDTDHRVTVQQTKKGPASKPISLKPAPKGRKQPAVEPDEEEEHRPYDPDDDDGEGVFIPGLELFGTAMNRPASTSSSNAAPSSGAALLSRLIPSKGVAVGAGAAKPQPAVLSSTARAGAAPASFASGRRASAGAIITEAEDAELDLDHDDDAEQQQRQLGGDEGDDNADDGGDIDAEVPLPSNSRAVQLKSASPSQNGHPDSTYHSPGKANSPSVSSPQRQQHGNASSGQQLMSPELTSSRRFVDGDDHDVDGAFNGRDNEEDSAVAATRIQAVARGRAARREVHRIRSHRSTHMSRPEQEEAEQATEVQGAPQHEIGVAEDENGPVQHAAAATRTQAVARGSAARKQVSGLRGGPKTHVEQDTLQGAEEAAPIGTAHLEREADNHPQADTADAVEAAAPDGESAAAATRIQSIARGRAARKRVQGMRAQEATGIPAGDVPALDDHHSTAKATDSDADALEPPEVTPQHNNHAAAATRIQAVARGRAARKQVAGLRTSAAPSSSSAATSSHDEVAAHDDQHEQQQPEQHEAAAAASELPAAAHEAGMDAAQVPEVQEGDGHSSTNNAATKIQAVARGRAARKQVTGLKQQRSSAASAAHASTTEEAEEEVVTPAATGAAAEPADGGAEAKHLIESGASDHVDAVPSDAVVQPAPAPKAASPSTDEQQAISGADPAVAATKIQSVARGRAARKHVAALKSSRSTAVGAGAADDTAAAAPHSGVTPADKEVAADQSQSAHASGDAHDGADSILTPEHAPDAAADTTSQEPATQQPAEVDVSAIATPADATMPVSPDVHQSVQDITLDEGQMMSITQAPVSPAKPQHDGVVAESVGGPKSPIAAEPADNSVAETPVKDETIATAHSEAAPASAVEQAEASAADATAHDAKPHVEAPAGESDLEAVHGKEPQHSAAVAVAAPDSLLSPSADNADAAAPNVLEDSLAQ